ncbi:hypothetical protein [Romboutsia ilealis]|uniref:hypothetical protein n=1 Tax=Romboutsia ilealis TaxID=1115758 RepID=UPI00272BA042|nr:hypothetical protein [Romboutsia ilealis]
MNLRQENKKYVTVDNDGSVILKLSTPITIMVEDGILMLKMNDKIMRVLDIFLLNYGEDTTDSLIDIHSRGKNDFQRAISNRKKTKCNYESIEKLLDEANEGELNINDICDIINLTITNYDHLVNGNESSCNEHLQMLLSAKVNPSSPINSNFINYTDGRKALISGRAIIEKLNKLKREQK